MSDVNKLFKEACKDIDFSKEPTEAEQLQIEVAKRQYLERESLQAQLAVSKKREEILREGLEKIIDTPYHHDQGGFGAFMNAHIVIPLAEKTLKKANEVK
jgi:hypothetical protein